MTHNNHSALDTAESGFEELGLKRHRQFCYEIVERGWGPWRSASRRRAVTRLILPASRIPIGVSQDMESMETDGQTGTEMRGLRAALGSLPDGGPCRWCSHRQLVWVHLGLTLGISVFTRCS